LFGGHAAARLFSRESRRADGASLAVLLMYARGPLEVYRCE